MLRPGPAITGPMHRIHDGSGALCRRWRSWMWPEEPTLGGVARRGLGSVTVAATAWTAVQASPGLMWVAVGGWCVAAWSADGNDEDQNDDGAEEGIADTEFVELVRALAPDGPGAHLVEIAERMAEVEPGRNWDTTHVREIAARIGLPIVSTRSRNRPGSSTGIRTKDLPPPSPDDTGPVAVVAAGQPSDNDNDDITTERIGEGGQIARHRAEASRRHTIRTRRRAA